MGESEIFEIVQTIIFLVGFGGLAYWLHALKGTVDAQRATIDAQKIFIENLATLLNAADAPKMLARYEAYKKIVDHEKAAILADYEKRLEEHRKLPRGLPGDLDRILGLVEELMPFVPAEKRQRLIEAAHLTAGYTEELAGIASTAPDLVAIADAAALKYLKAEDEAVTHRLGIISQRLDELFRQSAEKSAQTIEK